jgi:hypothetical protein
MTEETAPETTEPSHAFPDPLPSQRPHAFTVHTAESWARAIQAHAVFHARVLDDTGDVDVGPTRVFLSRMGDDLGVTVQIGQRLFCVKVGA